MTTVPKYNWLLLSVAYALTLLGVLYGTSLIAQEIPPVVQENRLEADKLFEAVSNTLSKNSVEQVEPAILNQYRQQLREFKQQAAQRINRASETLKTEQDLLDALGPAPEEGEIEDAELASQRKSLEKGIRDVNAELRQANLNIARSDELLGQIADLEQQRLKSKLSSRLTIPLLPTELQEGFKQAVIYAGNFDSWLKAIVLFSFLAAGCRLMIPASNLLNHQIKKSPGLSAQKISSYTLMQLLVAATIVLLFRFNLVRLDQYAQLENLLQAVSSAWLALMLFRILGKIRLQPKDATDQYGSKIKSYAWLWDGLRRVLRLSVAIIPILALGGFIELAAYLSLNLFASIFGLMLFAIMRGVAVLAALRFTAKSAPKDGTAKEKVEDEALSPLAISILEPVFALIVFSMVLFFWGMTTEDLESWLETYRNGIPIGNITLDFSDIGAGISAFALLFGITKILQWFLGSRVLPYTHLDAGIKNAALTVVGYIGIIAAILSAFGALGLSMENLAIVAGALSVGIGFGLQAIFSNFVSGLILLFERPVKVGDMVIVGGEQGVIRKIRVRSTEIETFWNSNIIVPNSQLISETVTNWTLHNRVGRVDVKIGVAYGSDTEKVSEVLLKVAEGHPSVRRYPESKVFFMDFGESSLDFELRCFISNIRDIYRVMSELRFAIDKAFREHGIEIPFPQRDLHIRSGFKEGLQEGLVRKQSADADSAKEVTADLEK